MTQRKEPTISLTSINGNTILAGLGFGPKKKTHGELVESALSAFTKAEQEMNEAIQLIDADVAAEQQAIRDAEQRIDEASNSRNRLSRVLDRLKALTE